MDIEKIKKDIEERDRIFKGVQKTIVVFGSARIHKADTSTPVINRAKEEIRLLSKKAIDTVFPDLISEDIAKNKKQTFHVVTGGGPGIMEWANVAGKTKTHKSIGIGIDLPFEQGLNAGVVPSRGATLNYFFTRKTAFLHKAECYVVFPGGFGTLDEFFEIITLMQTGKIPRKKVVLYGASFWERLIKFQTLAEYGMINWEDLNLFKIVNSSGALLNELRFILD